MRDRSILAALMQCPSSSCNRKYTTIGAQTAPGADPASQFQKIAKTYPVRARDSSEPQPRSNAFAQRAQELARDKSRDANADHSNHDLFVRAADVRVPDEESKAAAARAADLAPPARDHFRRHHDFPGNSHSDRRADHDRWQRAGQDNAPENIRLARSHRSRRLKVAQIDASRAAHDVDDDREKCTEEGHESNRHLLRRPEEDRSRNPGKRRYWSQHLENGKAHAKRGSTDREEQANA